MKNMKSTKRSLFLSAMALLLCTSMLIGTTYAWFTESVSSVNNIITGGNLDVELKWSADGSTWKDVDANTNVFTSSLWEPGHTEVVYLKVSNVGDLSLKYQLGVNVASETPAVNADGDQIWLSQYIKFGVVESGKVYAQGERAQAIADVQASAKLLKEGYSKSSTLYPTNTEKTTSETVALVVYMPETVGNEANYVGEVAPKINLGINLIATQFTWENDSFDEYYDGGAGWTGAIDTSWYDPDATELTIGSAEELAGLAAIVNGTAMPSVVTYGATSATPIKDDFKGQTITLASDIDLEGKAWTPIGNWSNTFAGTFDGNGYTISNLYINDPEGEGVGLFGVVENANIKGITLENVKVNAYSMVAGMVGAAYPATISDCHITGEIEIVSEWAYVAGIAGYCYYGTQVDGCSTIAKNTGLIKSETRNAVGGITAWLLEGDHKVTNCQVKNLDLIGWSNVGGITGFVHYNNTIDGCSVENVNLVKTRADGAPGIGLIAGGFSYSASNSITIKNNVVTNATLSGTHIAYDVDVDNELFGSEYGGATTTNFVLENNTVSGITNNLVEVKVIKTAADLKAALTNGGDNYILTADIAVAKNETIAIANGVSATIDLNGHKITSTADKTGNQELFLVKGDLTVKNGSMEYVASNNQEWNAMITIFDVTAGGVLNMEKVTANVGGSDMNFIVHLNNWGTASLYVNDCDFTTTYVAVRAFNSGYDMNNVTIKNTDFHGGRVFWVHNYTSEGKDDSTLNLDIYGNNNTSDNQKSVRFGFTDSLYYTIEGKLLVSAATQTDFANALNAGNKVIVSLDAGNYTIPSTVAGKEVTIVGSGDDTVFDFTKAYNVGSATITFENVKFQGKNENVMNGFGVQHTTGTIVYKNCTFDGAVTNEFYGDVEYIDCTFTGTGYITTYAVKSAKFEGCTFDKADSRALLVYSHGDNPVVVTITDCTFKAAAKATTWAGDWTAAIEVDTTNIKTAGTSVTVENCTYDANCSGLVRDKSAANATPAVITIDGVKQ